jgi:hypothetical protein
MSSIASARASGSPPVPESSTKTRRWWIGSAAIWAKSTWVQQWHPQHLRRGPRRAVQPIRPRTEGGKKYGALINPENLCEKSQRANALVTAQNEAVLQTKPLIADTYKNKKSKGHGKKHSKKK